MGMTDCFGEYDYRQNVIQVQHDLWSRMANTIFHEICMHAVQVAGYSSKDKAR